MAEDEFVTLSVGVTESRAYRETAGAVRFRRGGDMGHPERILQQQFMIEEYVGGRMSSIRTEWRDVPWLNWGEDEA